VPHWCRILGEIPANPIKFYINEYAMNILICKGLYIKINVHKTPALKAHNLKVVGSNPAPATKQSNGFKKLKNLS
jgi:hypothetical protein